MTQRRLAAWYAAGVGLAIVGLWTVLVATGQVPELRTAPLVGFHLLAELATALAPLAAGVGRLRGRAWTDRLFPVALGMLLYTTVNSAGHYAGLAEWPVVVAFGALTVTTLLMLRWGVFGGRMAPNPPSRRTSERGPVRGR